MSAFGQIPVSQYSVVLKDRVMFWVQNDDHVRGSHVHTPKPKDISFDPPRITKPPFPAVTQASLRIMLPGIFHVEFDCEKHCRSAGICVHFQFVIGAKRCPDGLVCPRCRQAKEEVVCLYLSLPRWMLTTFRSSRRPDNVLCTIDQVS
jgi:hypothetical protein